MSIKYRVHDSFNSNELGVYHTREDLHSGIRQYCITKLMGKVSLFDQDFIKLSDKEDYIVYENPIGYFPEKPKFTVTEIYV